MEAALTTSAHSNLILWICSVDGVNDEKLNDYGIGVRAGSDGNGYIVGYSLKSLSTGTDLVQQPILVIVSPTGKTLLRHKVDLGELPFQRVVDMQLVESSASSKFIYIFGESKERDSAFSPAKLSISGVEIPDGSVPIFGGFDGAITSQGVGGADSNEEQSNEQESSKSFPLAPVAGSAIGLVVIALAAGVFMAVKMNNVAGNSARADVEDALGSNPSPVAPAQLR